MVACLLWGVATAGACGYHRHASATGKRTPGQRAALVIGDSTMILATPGLGARGLETDAKECRQFSDGVRMVAARRAAGTLPHLVVMALGANGPVSIDALERLRRTVGPDRVLAVVTPPNLGASQASMRTLGRRHPAQVIVMDWDRYGAAHPSVFAGDGIHPTNSGATVMADFIATRAAPVIKPPSRRWYLPRHSTRAKDCGVTRRFGRAYRVKVTTGRDRITCRRARQLATRPPLRPILGWRWADWSPLPGPWIDAYRRTDGRIIVATVAS